MQAKLAVRVVTVVFSELAIVMAVTLDEIVVCQYLKTLLDSADLVPLVDWIGFAVLVSDSKTELRVMWKTLLLSCCSKRQILLCLHVLFAMWLVC